MSTTSEPEYRLPLPTPAQAKALAEGIEVAIPPDLATSLAELAAANGSGDIRSIEETTAAVVARFTLDPAHNLPCGAAGDRFTIYAAYFELNRLPDNASKQRAMEALTVALAVVMKDAARAETAKGGVTPVEFGILRQAFAVVIETLSEVPVTNP